MQGAAAQDIATPPVEDRVRATECLALAIAYEAGYEPVEGQEAVAEVVLNRVRSPSFPKTVCDVVFAGSTRRTGCQFTFTCDGSLYRRRPSEAVFRAAREVAENVLAGRAPPRVAGATHYHADYVSPYWAPSLSRVGKIGTHIFYQPPGSGTAQIAGASKIADPVDSASARPARDHGQDAGQTFTPWGLALASPAPAVPQSQER